MDSISIVKKALAEEEFRAWVIGNIIYGIKEKDKRVALFLDLLKDIYMKDHNNEKIEMIKQMIEWKT